MKPITALVVAVALAPPAIGSEDNPLGASRDDLDRFYGIKGAPEDETGRDFFVAPAKAPVWQKIEIPEGHLMMGAMGGDVAPWYMASIGDTRFEQRYIGSQPEPLIVDLETAGEGQATALSFETVFTERGTIERLGDLPEDW